MQVKFISGYFLTGLNMWKNDEKKLIEKDRIKVGELILPKGFS